MTKVRDYVVIAAGLAIILHIFGFASVARTVAQSSAAAVQQVFVTNSNSKPVLARINNPPNAPVLVRDVDSARQDFTWDVAINLTFHYGQGQFSVPAGKRMVIESVSASCFVPSGYQIVEAYFATTAKTPSGDVLEGFQHYFNLLPLGDTGTTTYSQGSSSMRVTAEPGSTVKIAVLRLPIGQKEGSCRIAFSGYLVKVP